MRKTLGFPSSFLIRLLALLVTTGALVACGGGGGGGGTTGGNTNTGNNTSGNSNQQQNNASPDLVSQQDESLTPYPAPKLVSSNPGKDAINVPVNQVVTANFDIPLASAATCTIKEHVVHTMQTTLHIDHSQETSVLCKATVVNNTVTIKPDTTAATWTAAKHYDITLNVTNKDAANLKDSEGKAVNLSTNFPLAFLTVKADADQNKDTTPPQLVSSVPANSSNDVPLTQKFSATFNEDLNTTAPACNVHTNPEQSNLTCTASVSGKTVNVTFKVNGADSNWAYGTGYTVLLTGIKDVAGNSINSSIGFTTVAAPASNTTNNNTSTSTDTPNSNTNTVVAPVVHTDPPKLLTSNPTNGATNVPVNQIVKVTFDEPLHLTGVTCTVLSAPVSPTPLNCTPTVKTDSVEIKLTNTSGAQTNWDYSTQYLVVLNGVKDSYGVDAAGATSISFTTVANTSEPPKDTTPPTLATSNPINGSRLVSVDQALLFTFNEELQTSGITCTMQYRMSTSGAYTDDSSSCAVTVNNNTVTVVRKISNVITHLVQNGYYSVQLQGVKDKAGNAMPVPPTITFVTKWIPPVSQLWRSECLLMNVGDYPTDSSINWDVLCMLANPATNADSGVRYLPVTELPDSNIFTVSISEIRARQNNLWIKIQNLPSTNATNFASIQVVSADTGAPVSEVTYLPMVGTPTYRWRLKTVYKAFVGGAPLLFLKGDHGCHPFGLQYQSAAIRYKLSAFEVETCPAPML